MYELTLMWTENGQVKTAIINDEYPSKHPGTIRIGRHPLQCDIVLSDRTVSGLHVEIFFESTLKQFCLRNLRASNPPMVDEKNLVAEGEVVPLKPESTIYLGQIAIKIIGMNMSEIGVDPTVVMAPHPQAKPLNSNGDLHNNSEQVKPLVQIFPIEIDEENKARMLGNIIESDYFKNLQKIAAELRSTSPDETANSELEPVEHNAKGEVENYSFSPSPTSPPRRHPQKVCPKCEHIPANIQDKWCIKCGTRLQDLNSL